MSSSTDGDRAFALRAARWGITGASVLALLLVLLWLLKAALTPLAVAWVIAYLLDPWIDAFERRRIPRGVAVLLLLLLLGALGVAAALFLIPTMQRELAAASARLPEYLARASAYLLPLLERELGLSLPASVSDAVASLRAGDIPIPIDAARALLEQTLRAITGTVGAIVSLLVIPVLAYYLVVEFDRIRLGVLALVPRHYQARVREDAARVDRLVSGFIRGQLSICAALGVLYALGFSLIGIDLALVIGVASGVAAIIPYVGGALALGSASAMCLLQYGVGVQLALVVGWYALVQGLEGMILTPRILGDSLGMHPLVVILALMIGADLLGFLGLMIAVPLAAVVQVFVQDAVAAYRASVFYREAAEGDAPDRALAAGRRPDAKLAE
jgi:predicted PurR-regulated permease PerM